MTDKIEKDIEIIDTKSMNIFQKIQNIRVEIKKKSLKKSGHNKFSDFKYFLLEDFIAETDELLLKYGLFTHEDIRQETATLFVIDTDKPNDEPFTITIETANVELKGMNAIQNIGSKITYTKRYLYVELLNLAEGDNVDASSGKEEKKKPNKKEDDDGEKSNLEKLKDMMTELSNNGKKDEASEVLSKIAKVKNPNSIKDENIILEVIAGLEKIK